MEETEYLYHYTSLESLALILKNRTIRLNPLDKMDDLQEQKAADVENAGKFIFVSSWTDDPTESIPMWKMYTNSTSGVRIKLKKNPFQRHETYAKDIVQKTGLQLTPDSDPNGKIHTFLDISEMIAGGYYSVQAFRGDILAKVVYTDDKSLLEPQILSQNNAGTRLSLGSLGFHKSTYWAFQKEWRYRMLFTNVPFNSNMNEMEQKAFESMFRMIHGVEKPPFRYYDLDIASDAFAEMEIMCSPQMSVGNQVLLNALVEKFNPTANVIQSDLFGKL